MKIKTLIVDDEPLARERIRALLAPHAGFEVLAECANGMTAVQAITNLQPDLVFLDVQMPELGGFEVLEALAHERLPAIIFVTAYDNYALRAFEVHALDYLLKPFDRERFAKALQRAQEYVQHGQNALQQRLQNLLEELQRERRYVERLVLKTAGRVFFVKVAEVDWAEAEANYVRLHAGRETHLLRETLTHLETKLDPQKFLRLSRSLLVNLDRIKELQPWSNNGEYVVILQNGARLRSSRNYRARVESVFKPA